MRTGTDSRKQRILAGVLGVCALGAVVYLYEELFGGSSTPAPAPAVVAAPRAAGNTGAQNRTAGPVARTVGTTSAGLDPTLHMDAMLVSESVVYSGSGRNIFSANSAPAVVIPRPIATARVNLQPAIPCPPNCPPPPGPPPPPPIDLKFFGTMAGLNGRQAFLLHDESVILASAGDIVLRRYHVITIDAKSILVEDMQNKNRQTLPLTAN